MLPLPHTTPASEKRFSRFTSRDADLVCWRFGRGYVAEIARRRYRRMFHGARRILDVGCGTGEAARWANDADYVGIDLSEELVRRGAARPGRQLAAASVTALPFSDGTFDRAVVMGVLHHLAPDQMPAALQEVARTLEAGGEIVIVEPNPWNLFQRLLAWVRPAERGILGTSPRRLRRALESVAGLRLVTFAYDHTMFWPAHLTFLLRRWAWPTGPRLTACFRILHRAVTALTPGPLQSHTFWRLRKEPPAAAGGHVPRHGTCHAQSRLTGCFHRRPPGYGGQARTRLGRR